MAPRKSRIATGAFIAALALVALLAAAPRAHAQAPLSVTILAPWETTQAGGEAVFVIVVTGPGAGDAIVDVYADGGTVMQQLGLTEGEPGVATATVWVRRDQPGAATLIARTRDGAAAAATANFGGEPELAATATIQVTLTVDGPADGAARTWLFDVLDSDGLVVAELVAFTSGDAPSDIAVTSALPAGAYTVRRSTDSTLTTDCADGGFYEVVSPTTGAAGVTLGESGSQTVAFRFAVCPTGTGDGSGPSGTPTQLVAGSRTDGSPTPLPPATGTGAATSGPAFPWWAFAGVLLVMTGASGWVVFARMPRVSSRG